MKCKDCNKREINLVRSTRCCDVCLDKRLSRQKNYYKDNREKEIGKNVEYTKRRRERLKKQKLCIVCGKYVVELKKNFCIFCLEKNKTQRKLYRAKNKKKIQDSQKRSMAKKPELYKALKHRVYENHKGDWYRWSRERRDRKLKAEGSYTEDEWNNVLRLYEGRCLCCGSTKRIEADHVVPLAKGGTDYISNIQPLCRICNARKGAKTLDFRVFGSAILEWT